MFTGIIEEIGKVRNTPLISGGISINVEALRILEDISVNDSICIDGVCLTVTKVYDSGFWTDAVGTTLEKTTLAEIKASTLVNLERALRLSDRLGGHIVQGHVSGIGNISEIKKLGDNYLLKIDVPQEQAKYLVKEGSIAINGISLTIADLRKNIVLVSIVPHTWRNTTLQYNRVNNKVNIEIDVLAKYVEKFQSRNVDSTGNNITENWLKELGF